MKNILFGYLVFFQVFFTCLIIPYAYGDWSTAECRAQIVYSTMLVGGASVGQTTPLYNESDGSVSWTGYDGTYDYECYRSYNCSMYYENGQWYQHQCIFAFTLAEIGPFGGTAYSVWDTPISIANERYPEACSDPCLVSQNNLISACGGEQKIIWDEERCFGACKNKNIGPPELPEQCF